MKNKNSFMFIVLFIWMGAVGSQKTNFIILAFILTLISLPIWTYFTAKSYQMPVKKWVILSICIPFVVPIILAFKTGRQVRAGAENVNTYVPEKPFNVYRSDEWAFSIKYPSSWEIDFENETAGSWSVPVAVKGPSRDGFNPSFMVNCHRYELLQGSQSIKVFQTLSDGSVKEMPWNPMEYNKQTILQVQSAFSGFQLIEATETKLAGRIPAAKEVYSYYDARGKVIEVSVTAFCKGGTFQFICNMPEQNKTYYMDVFKAILNAVTIAFEAYEVPVTDTDNEAAGYVETYGLNVSEAMIQAAFQAENNLLKSNAYQYGQGGSGKQARNNALIWGATAVIVIAIIAFSLMNQGKNKNVNNDYENQNKTESQSIAGPSNFSGMPGSRSGDLANGGYLCENNAENIYYSLQSTGKGLFKYNYFTGEIKKICEDSATHINAYNEYVFYINRDDGKIYKLNTNRGTKDAILGEKASELFIIDGWVFYTPSEGKGIYRINADGSGKVRICKDKAKNVNVFYDSIQYINLSDDSKLYRIDINGSMKKKLTDKPAEVMIQENSYLYFISKSDKKLYKTESYSGATTRLTDDAVSIFNIASGRIIYKVKDNIVSINENGGNKENFMNGSSIDWLAMSYTYLYYPAGDKIIMSSLGTGEADRELGSQETMGNTIQIPEPPAPPELSPAQ